MPTEAQVFGVFDDLGRLVGLRDRSKDSGMVRVGNAERPQRSHLIATGRTGPVFGPGTFPLIRKTIAGGSIRGGSVLDLRGHFAKYQPFNGGGSIVVRMTQGANSVDVWSATVGATVGSVPLVASVAFAGDRRFAFYRGLNSPNINGVQALAPGAYGLDNIINLDAPSSKSARTTGGAAFATYSAPPTVETVLIDFDRDVTLQVLATIANGDCVEMLAFGLDVLNPPQSADAMPGGLVSAIWGTSLVEGTGAAANQDVATQLGKLRPGRSVINAGLGGQLAQPVADRIVADAGVGRYGDAILWFAENNASGDGPAWWAAVDTQIRKVLAYRDPAAKTLICDVIPSTDWNATIMAAMAYVNGRIQSDYGAIKVPLNAALATDAGGYVPAALRADAIHLVGAGYGIAAATMNAAATGAGWA